MPIKKIILEEEDLSEEEEEEMDEDKDEVEIGLGDTSYDEQPEDEE